MKTGKQGRCEKLPPETFRVGGGRQGGWKSERVLGSCSDSQQSTVCARSTDAPTSCDPKGIEQPKQLWIAPGKNIVPQGKGKYLEALILKINIRESICAA